MLHVGSPLASRSVMVPAVAVYGMALPASVSESWVDESPSAPLEAAGAAAAGDAEPEGAPAPNAGAAAPNSMVIARIQNNDFIGAPNGVVCGRIMSAGPSRTTSRGPT